MRTIIVGITIVALGRSPRLRRVVQPQEKESMTKPARLATDRLAKRTPASSK